MTLTKNDATSVGWILFIAALGAMAILVSSDLATIQTWDQARTPPFIAKMLAHLGAVIGAFIGGKIIPAARDSLYTRSTDVPPITTKETTV